MSARNTALGVVAVGALAAVAFVVARWIASPAADSSSAEPTLTPPDNPPDLAPGEQLVEVREHDIPTYEVFGGKVHAEGRYAVRAPLGMIIPILKLHKESGDKVAQGDILFEFDEQQLLRAIEKADQDKREDDAKRYRSYLPFVKFRSPVTGQVLQVNVDEGHTPLNREDGMPLMELADESSYSVKVDLPVGLTAVAAFLGAKLRVRIEAGAAREVAELDGEVVGYDQGPEGMQRIVIRIPPEQGVERDAVASVRIASGKKTVGLVPKTALFERKGIQMVRVWDALDRSIADRTVLLGETMGEEVIVTAGVYAGESVVVPKKRR